MLLPRLATLALAISLASAYDHASPFFLLSSDPLREDAPLKHATLALGTSIQSRLLSTLSQCEHQHYYVFSQASVTAEDLRNGHMPTLEGSLGDGRVEESKFVGIPDVVDDGGLKMEDIVDGIRRACEGRRRRQVDGAPNADDEFTITSTTLQELPEDAQDRARRRDVTDVALMNPVKSVLSKQDGISAVLIYMTSPPSESASMENESTPYEMDDPYPEAPHTDLKRDLSHRRRQSSSDNNMQAGLPLFEKYQFFTPPLFMGLSVSILLLAILYVGLRAISGLEVSYMAFSKEMGPQAQKKQQ